MFHPTFEDFFRYHGGSIDQKRIVFFLDIDGVIRIRKGAVLREIVSALYTLSTQHGVMFIPITGAPIHQLPLEILWPRVPLYRAFAESGGVERLSDGTLLPEDLIANEFQDLIAHLAINPKDGLLDIPALGKSIICEGQRYTSFTAIMGETYPPYPQSVPTAQHQQVYGWLADIIRAHALPFLLIHGHEQTYSYIDVIHRDVGKAWRVGLVLDETPHDFAFYIGDGPGDEEAMALPKVIPIALANSTTRIRQEGQQRGFVIAKSGPDGTYEILTALIAYLQQTL